MKTTQLFLNITDWIWAYDEFALLMKNATTRLKMLAYSLFALNDTLDHIFTFFIFLTIDFFHGHGQENLTSCPGPVKIVVNFLHRVCTMLQMICT